MPNQHDMKPRALPECWFCKKPVKIGHLFLQVPPEHIVLDSAQMTKDYRPVCWRYGHSECYANSTLPKTNGLDTTMPQTFVAWIMLTIRLLDQKGSYFLFDITNFRYVLDCVQADYVPGLNEWVDPVVKKKPRAIIKRKIIKPRKIIRRA